MKYTYRGEYLFRFEEISGCLFFILLWLAFSILSWITSPPLIIIFLILTTINIWLTFRYAVKRSLKARDYRRHMMTRGIQYRGNIVNAGGGVVNVRERYYDKRSRKYRIRTTRLPDYWVEVEYQDSSDHTVKTCRSGEFGRNTHGLIGRNVQVYTCDGKFYINIP